MSHSIIDSLSVLSEGTYPRAKFDISDLIYCDLSIEYDRERLIEEFDSYRPHMVSFCNGLKSWVRTREKNKRWNMVSTTDYDRCDVRGDDYTTIFRGIPAWIGTSLIYLPHSDEKIRALSWSGSVSVRNMACAGFLWKPEFKNSYLVSFIQSLPLHDICGARLILLDRGCFACIHKDNTTYGLTEYGTAGSSLGNNALWKKHGLVSITINLSNGGVPLFFEDSQGTLHKADGPTYLFNDFYDHGVPLTTDIRRQIRVTGRPSKRLQELLQYNHRTAWEENTEIDCNTTILTTKLNR